MFIPDLLRFRKQSCVVRAMLALPIGFAIQFPV